MILKLAKKRNTQPNPKDIDHCPVERTKKNGNIQKVRKLFKEYTDWSKIL